MARTRKRPTTADRYGDIGAGAEWNAILEHYYWDRVELALELANNLGAVYGGATLRMYRLVEGEAVTRSRSVVTRASPWLQWEAIAGEVEGVESLPERAIEACDNVARRLGWNHSRQTMISVLATEADAPWHAARFGYYENKHPYDKICVPNSVCFEPGDLEAVVRHEYAHLIVTHLSEGKAPLWVHEGIAMLMEGGPGFPVTSWLSQERLEQAFGAERRETGAARRVHAAYAQAAAIVRKLYSIDGDEGLRRFLGSFAEKSFWTELKMRMMDVPPVDAALRDTFGLGIKDFWSESPRLRQN